MLPQGNRANFIFWVSPISVSNFCLGIRKYPPTVIKKHHPAIDRTVRDGSVCDCVSAYAASDIGATNRGFLKDAFAANDEEHVGGGKS